jgi:hypothetical protein
MSTTNYSNKLKFHQPVKEVKIWPCTKNKNDNRPIWTLFLWQIKLGKKIVKGKNEYLVYIYCWSPSNLYSPAQLHCTIFIKQTTTHSMTKKQSQENQY